jgi:transposase-like protein
MSRPVSPRRKLVAEAYARLGGNISAIARELEIDRSTVQHHVKALGHKKPLAGGSVLGTPRKELPGSSGTS